MKPAVEVHTDAHALVAEFWECLKLDPAPVKDLRTKYEAHLKSGGRPILVVDLLGVVYALSTALSQFLTLQRFVRTQGGTTIFCNLDPMVREVFRISKLESLFEFAQDRPAALQRAAELDGSPALGGPAPSSGAAPAPPAADESGAPPPESRPAARPSPDSGGGNLLRRHRRRML
jgi:anti-anti-sigma factor